MKKCKRIALIGLDGSGKSANIIAMKQDDAFEQYCFMWVRWKPKLLWPAYFWVRKKIEKKETCAPQKQLNVEYNMKKGMKGRIFKNPMVRKVWIALALIDYLFQFYIKAMKALVEKKNIVFDRFYLDLFVDQGINFSYSPEKIEREIKKYQKLFPRIDQIIYIRVSPEMCYGRKDDIPSIDYLLKRFEVYEKLSCNSNWVTVDGETGFNEVYSNIKEKILGK